MSAAKISIITVTYDREALLQRCMESIAAQDYPGPMEHILVGDGSEFLLARESFFRSYYKKREVNVEVTILHRPRDTSRYVWERIASHQNQAVSAASGDYLANLDDDNTIAKNHLSSLSRKLAEGYEAVYSWRYIFHSDGRPFLLDRYPWIKEHDPLREELLYRIHCESGVFKPGSHRIEDSLYLEYRGTAYGTVDSSEWLWRSELFKSGQLRFVDHYSYEDLLFGHFDDYLLNKRIKELGLKVACTRLPTLNYYLSGYSQKAEAPIPGDHRGKKDNVR